jgi:hypothetical protein
MRKDLWLAQMEDGRPVHWVKGFRPPLRSRLGRARSVPANVLTRAERHEMRKLRRVKLPVLPANRSECRDAPRPCPFVSCKYHLYLDVNPDTGSIKLNYPGREPEELRETCALDVADDGPKPLEYIGEVMNLTRERVRQIEVRALVKLHMLGIYLEQGPRAASNFEPTRPPREADASEASEPVVPDDEQCPDDRRNGAQ